MAKMQMFSLNIDSVQKRTILEFSNTIVKHRSTIYIYNMCSEIACRLLNTYIHPVVHMCV